MNKSSEVKQNSIEQVGLNLGNLSCGITKGMTTTEPLFLELGQSLQAIYSESENLIQMITSSAQRFDVKSEENIIQVIERSIGDVLAELSGYPVKISDNMRHIGESGRYLEELVKLCNRFKTISRFLNAVGMNFGIEGCRSREAMDLFDGFAGEIKGLSARINEITEKIYADSIRALSEQKSGLSGIGERMEVVKDLTCEARDAVMKTMENIQSLADKSLKTLDQAQHTAHAIQKMVGEIVMAIQFHDIARQQLEHVTHAFDDVAQMLKEKILSAHGHEKDKIKIPDQMFSILKVQYEQIRHVTEEIDQAYEKIISSFQEISREVGSLQHLLDASNVSENNALSLDEEFESIINRMENLKHLQDQGRNLGSEMIKTIQESSDVVTALFQYAGQIDSINIGLQHKALNAIIMTTKLGKNGFTLEILAREVRNISVDCTGLVEAALKNLETISGIAALLTTGADEKSVQSFEGISLDKNIKKISGALETGRSDSDHASRVAHALEEKIEDTGKGLSFLKVWVEQLRQEGEALDGLISFIKPHLDSDNQGEADHIEILSQRYTMESERMIHHRVSGEPSKPGQSDDRLEKEIVKPVQDKETREKKEEFDDNIELF